MTPVSMATIGLIVLLATKWYNRKSPVLTIFHFPCGLISALVMALIIVVFRTEGLNPVIPAIMGALFAAIELLDAQLRIFREQAETQRWKTLYDETVTSTNPIMDEQRRLLTEQMTLMEEQSTLIKEANTATREALTGIQVLKAALNTELALRGQRMATVTAQGIITEPIEEAKDGTAQ